MGYGEVEANIEVLSLGAYSSQWMVLFYLSLYGTYFVYILGDQRRVSSSLAVVSRI